MLGQLTACARDIGLPANEFLYALGKNTFAEAQLAANEYAYGP